MRSGLFPSRMVLGALCVSMLMGCGDEGTKIVDDDTGELTLAGSSQAPGGVAPSLSPANPSSFQAQAPIGDPASWLIGLYSFHISMNADCSGPFVTAYDAGATAVSTDLTTDPTFFTASSVPIGTYPCVAMKISDILAFSPATSEGACVAGTTYEGDIYRAGGEDTPFRDLSLGIITATGTDEAPSEDGIFLFFTTDKTAAVARGLAFNQTIPLSSPLAVPDAVTFYWDATDAVVDDGDRCLLEPDAVGLFY